MHAIFIGIVHICRRRAEARGQIADSRYLPAEAAVRPQDIINSRADKMRGAAFSAREFFVCRRNACCTEGSSGAGSSRSGSGGRDVHVAEEHPKEAIPLSIFGRKKRAFDAVKQRRPLFTEN